MIHIDHALRPESRGDAAYVRRLGARWGAPVTVRRMDVPALRELERTSIEEAARKARHAAYLDAAATINAEAIVLGHNADDQVETVLLNLLRGTGLRGLAGMAAVAASPFQSASDSQTDGARISLLRPLLTLPRSDISDYIGSRRLRPRDDPSNRDPAHARNRIRHELAPLMEEIRGGASEAVLRASADARSTLRYLEGQAEAVRAAALTFDADANAVRIDPITYAGAHSVLRHNVLEHAVSSLNGSTEGLSRAHWAAMDDLLMMGRTGGPTEAAARPANDPREQWRVGVIQRAAAGSLAASFACRAVCARPDARRRLGADGAPLIGTRRRGGGKGRRR